MKSKKLKVGALALALVFAMSGSVFAAVQSGSGGHPSPDYPGTPGDTEYQVNSDTTFSIMSSDQNVENMSYTIPLYVTMAVSKGQAKVAVPTNYGITNTSTSDDTTAQPMNIAIVGMQFEKLANTFYHTVKEDPTATKDEKAIQLSIGNIIMPALDVPKTQDLKIDASQPGVFWNTTDGKYVPIPRSEGKGMFPIPISGLVATTPTTPRGEKKAAAQFRVRYSVSLLAADNTPLGTPYAGSVYQQAGLDKAPTN